MYVLTRVWFSGLLGAVFGYLGCLLAPLGLLLRPLGRAFGATWGGLGGSWSGLGRSWDGLVELCCRKLIFEKIKIDFRSILTSQKGSQREPKWS